MKLTVNGDVDDISTGGSSGQHTSSRDTCRIVRVHVDRKVRVLLPDGTDESEGKTR